MKTHLLFTIALMPLLFKAFAQDTSKIQVTFLTKNNQSAPVYQKIYLGDIETRGYDSNGLNYQYGTLTKTEFLFNAPHTGYFKVNSPIVLIMTDKYSYNMQFNVDNRASNQKWLLTPPGKDFKKGRKLKFCGLGGMILSSILAGAITAINVIQMDNYNLKMDSYNFMKEHSFPNPGNRPQKPQNLGARYLIPALTMSFSVGPLTKGRKLYYKNRPSAERLE